MKKIYVVSHTESRHHVDNLVGGWYDSELTEKGHDDALSIAKILCAESKIDTVYSSDLKRAASTAKPIVEASKAPLILSDAFREMRFGVAEGKDQAWLDKRIKPEDGLNRMDHRIIEGAETKREFAGRIYRFLGDQILPSASVVSTHSFAATYIIAWWIGMPLESVGYVNFGIKPGKITKLVEDDFFKNRSVTYLNH